MKQLLTMTKFQFIYLLTCSVLITIAILTGIVFMFIDKGISMLCAIGAIGILIIAMAWISIWRIGK